MKHLRKSTILISIAVIFILGQFYIGIQTIAGNYLTDFGFPEISSTILFGCVLLVTFIQHKKYSKLRKSLLLLSMISGLTIIFFLVDYSETAYTRVLEKQGKQLVVNSGIKSVDYSRLINIPEDHDEILPVSDKYLLVNFWATWCTPCLEEMPLLESFHKKYETEVLILGVTGHYRKSERADTVKNLQRINAMIEKLDISYPIAIDHEMNSWKSYGVSQMPVTVLFDQNRNLIDYRIGVKGTISILDRLEERFEATDE